MQMIFWYSVKVLWLTYRFSWIYSVDTPLLQVIILIIPNLSSILALFLNRDCCTLLPWRVFPGTPCLLCTWERPFLRGKWKLLILGPLLTKSSPNCLVGKVSLYLSREGFSLWNQLFKACWFVQFVSTIDLSVCLKKLKRQLGISCGVVQSMRGSLSYWL